MARRALVLAVSAGLVLLSPGGPGIVLAQAQPDALETALARVDRFMGLVQELRDLIDRTQFDVDALSLALAFEDAEAVVAWVREQIAYEPYAGLLRGPEGTLMGRAGNALDQAVLLARLLKDAGYDARVAEGRLSADDARRLLAGAFVAVEAPPIVTDEARFEAVLTELADLGGLPAERVRTALGPPAAPPATADDLASEVATATDRLRAWLAGAGLDVPGEDDAALLADAQAYHWVQYRSSANEAWRDAHPAFVDGDAALAVEATRTFADSVPSDLQHRFRVEVVVERRLGGELVEAPLGPAWERPIANLVGRPISFVNYPLVELWPEVGTAGLAAQDPLLAPLLDRELYPGGALFDLTGATVAPDAGGNAAGGVVRSVGGAFGRAAGGLAGGGDPAAFVTLVAQHLDLTLVGPGGTERRFRRTLVDRLSAEQRAAGNLDLAPWTDADLVPLLEETTFMLAPGSLAPGYALDRYLERLVVLRSAFGASVRAAYVPEAPLSRTDLAFAARDTVWLGHLSLYPLFDLAPTDVPTYRSEPALVLYRDAVAYGLPDASIDVVYSPRRVIGSDGAAGAAALMETGVWETAVEGVVLGTDREARHGTLDVFAGAEAAGIGVRVITPAEPAALGTVAMSEAARRHALADLAAGYAIVVPERPVDGRTAWWRVDPITGATLGVLDTGQGGELTQYDVLASVGFGAAAFALCMTAKSQHTNDSTGKNVTDCGKVGLATAGVVAGGILMPIAGGAGGPAVAFAFWTAVAALVFEVSGLMFPE